MNSKQLIFLAAAFLISGCAGTYTSNIDFNPREPLRVAVLPFGQVNDSDEFVNEDGKLLVDGVPFISSGDEESPSQLVQRLVQNDFSKSGLDLVSPVVVERNLSHSSVAKGEMLDIRQIFSAPAKELGELLACDAVLYGKVTAWDRSYYGLQSVNTVGVDLKLVSVKTGKVLFSAAAEDSESRGLTKGPTGFSSLVIEPLRGLDSDIIANLAQEVVAKMLKPLHVENRPEFLKEPPPAIFAAAHDSLDGLIRAEGALTVVAVGSRGDLASFSIGNVVENVPMVEKDPGHYIGEFYPVTADTFPPQTVRVQLTDKYGRTTIQKIGRGAVKLGSN